MADFTTNMSDKTQLADHLITLYQRTVIIEKESLAQGIDATVTVRFTGGAQTHSFPKYSELTRQTSALTESTDPTSEAMVDTAITLTNQEYGNVVTYTKQVDVFSGGLPAVAAVRLAAKNMVESQESKMITVGEAGSNELIVTQAAEASLTASDNMTAAYFKYAYNKLQRVGAPTPYYAIIHPDVYYDLVTDTGTDAFISVARYGDHMSVLRNEVGMLGGFRVIVHPLVTINADAGNGAVDTYHSQFYAENGFGKSVGVEPQVLMTGPYDKLNRFINVGWYGIYDYGLIDTDRQWIVTAASSIGSNT